MSALYIRRAWQAARAAGGWDGPATRAAMESRLIVLHALGLTSRAAGAVLAREYQLHSASAGWRELADL